jgi:hypothetical protein
MSSPSFQGSAPLAAMIFVAGNSFVAIFFASQLGFIDAKKLSAIVVFLIGVMAVALAMLQLFSRIIRRVRLVFDFEHTDRPRSTLPAIAESSLFMFFAVTSAVFLGLFVYRTGTKYSLYTGLSTAPSFDSGFSQELLGVTSTVAWLVAKATRNDALHMFHYLASTLFVMSLGCSLVDLVEKIDPLQFLVISASLLMKIPAILSDFDTKQATFFLPFCLCPISSICSCFLGVQLDSGFTCSVRERKIPILAGVRTRLYFC